MLAAKGETLRLCKCGAVIDVAKLKAEAADTLNRYHKTLTPTGCSQWLRDDYGLDVPAMTVKNWLRRGKLPSSKPVGDDGYYEFDIRETVSMAMAYSRRQ